MNLTFDNLRLPKTHITTWTHDNRPVTRSVFLAWTWPAWECAELVGVYRTKSAAYRAARQALNTMILDYWNTWQHDSRMRHCYDFLWHVEEKEIE